MARPWFLRVLLNSSSFSAILRSISCLTCPSSSWARSTLFSSASRADSASSRAACSSSFSHSSLRRCLSSSWMERPPSPSWSRRSLTSSARFLFSRRTMSSCSLVSSRAALMRKVSELELRHSAWLASSSAVMSSPLAFHSPTTLSKLRPLFSVMMAAAWVLSYSICSSSRSTSILCLDFSVEATFWLRESITSSDSATREASLCLVDSSSSMRPSPSVSNLDFHSWISAWALERARRTSFFFSASSSILSRRFSDSVLRFLNLVSREARSRASASPSLLVSSSWVLREILFLARAPIAFSVSSIWRQRSWFSTCSFFLVESASLRARAISSSFWLDSTIRPWVILQFFSMLARSRMASSSPALVSWRSRSMPALSFSDLALFLLRPSMVSPMSAMVLLCLERRAARVPSWAMLDSSSSPFSLASSASRFLLSSIWVEVLEPTSSMRPPRSSMSRDRMERFFSALARLPRSMFNSSSSSSSLPWSSLTCLAYLLPRVCSSSILAARLETSFSFLCTAWPISLLMRSRSDTASWVSLRSPSTLRFIFSASPLDFFSRSRASSHSSRDCSSLPLTLLRWLQRSSMDWMFSSVFWRPSPMDFFSLPSLAIRSSWWAISSRRVRIWLSLVILSSSHFSMVLSRSLIWSRSMLASAVTLVPAWLMPPMASSSPLMRILVSSTCFWRSFFAPSMRLVLSMMSWTMEPLVNLLDGIALGNSLVDVGLGRGDLVLVLLLELAELAALEVGLDGHPQLGPLPGLGRVHCPDGPLDAVERQLLFLQLLVLDTGVLTTGSGLQVGEDRADLVLANLLDVTENTGAEEDLGVAETVFLGLELGHVKASLGGALVVLGLGHGLGGEDVVAGLELGVGHLVGEAHTADSDTGQDTVALVLVHHQARLDTSGDLVGVGHHATDEAGVGLVEGVHQVVQLALEVGGDSLAATLLLLTAPVVLLSLQRLAGMILETPDQQLVATVLHELDNGVVERILVLLQPARQVVGDGGGVVDDGEMGVGIGPRVGLGKVGPLSEEVIHQLGSKGLIGGLGEERLLLKDGEQAHGFLKHIDTFLEIHAKVAVGPLDALLNILLLLEDEHVVVEELLELLITEVDTDLLEAIVIENLKSSNVEDTNVGAFLHGRIDECLVTFFSNDTEGTLVDGTGNASHGVGRSRAGGALGDPLGADL